MARLGSFGSLLAFFSFLVSFFSFFSLFSFLPLLLFLLPAMPRQHASAAPQAHLPTTLPRQQQYGCGGAAGASPPLPAAQYAMRTRPKTDLFLGASPSEPEPLASSLPESPSSCHHLLITAGSTIR